MGNAIGGIGSLLGAASSSYRQQQINPWAKGYFPVSTETKKTFSCPCGKCRMSKNFDSDTMTIAQSAECWLTERVDRVRLRGKEWLAGKSRVVKFDALSNKPIAFAPTYDSSTRYTRRLRNGDEVFVYPKTEDWAHNESALNAWGVP